MKALCGNLCPWGSDKNVNCVCLEWLSRRVARGTTSTGSENGVDEERSGEETKRGEERKCVKRRDETRILERRKRRCARCRRKSLRDLAAQPAHKRAGVNHPPGYLAASHL